MKETLHVSRCYIDVTIYIIAAKKRLKKTICVEWRLESIWEALNKIMEQTIRTLLRILDKNGIANTHSNAPFI